jgi:hypothetical protein
MNGDQNLSFGYLKDRRYLVETHECIKRGDIIMMCSLDHKKKN